MPARDLRQSNCLGVGYCRQPVFVGRRGRGLEDFAGRAGALGGRPGAISAGSGRVGSWAAGSIELAASITENQALSRAARIAVATGPSQRRCGVADSCGFAVPRRLIASYRTRRAHGLELGPIGAAGDDQAEGGGPPFAIARVPHAGRADHAGNLENPGHGSGPRPARDRSPSGEQQLRRERGAKISRWQTGSGVRPAQTRGRLAAKGGAKVALLWNRVRVSHWAFDLGRGADSATGRG